MCRFSGDHAHSGTGANPMFMRVAEVLQGRLRKVFIAQIHLLAQTLGPQLHPLPSLNQRCIGLSRLAACALIHNITPQQITPHGLHIQPVRCRAQTRQRVVAAPRPLGRVVHQLGAHPVQLHVAAHLQQIGIAVDQNGLESPLKQMPHLAMAAVETLGIDTVDMAHQQRQIGLPRVKNKVIVVVHQAPCQGACIKPMQRLAQNAQQVFAILVAQYDGLAPVAPRSHVIHSAGELDAQGSCHIQKLRRV